VFGLFLVDLKERAPFVVKFLFYLKQLTLLFNLEEISK
jgi:hypothetical protein